MFQGSYLNASELNAYFEQYLIAKMEQKEHYAIPDNTQPGNEEKANSLCQQGEAEYKYRIDVSKFQMGAFRNSSATGDISNNKSRQMKHMRRKKKQTKQCSGN